MVFNSTHIFKKRHYTVKPYLKFLYTSTLSQLIVIAYAIHKTSFFNFNIKDSLKSICYIKGENMKNIKK